MNIIIVDDEQNALDDLYEAVKEIVGSESSISCFNSSNDALKHFCENPSDIIFLDIEMPGINGLIFAKQVKERSPKTNIIFVTGYAQYALDSYSVSASGYLLKPVNLKKVRKAIADLRHPLTYSTSRIRAHTFGNFDIFVDDVPLAFRRAKSKELLAYLIDRKGATVNVSEIAAMLFEDKPYELSVQKQVQVFISEMMKTLKSADAQDMIIKQFNSLAVNPDIFQCDYYDFMQMKPYAIAAYEGEYMANYSWAEFKTAIFHEQIISAKKLL